MNDEHTAVGGMGGLGDDDQHRKRDQAEGHSFAIQTLAETRYRTKQYITALNSTDSIAPNSIFLPDGAQPEDHPHTGAHASLLTYYDELTKPTYIKRAGAKEFFEQEFATVTIPADLADGGTITVTVEDPRNEFDPSTADIEMTQWPIALKNLSWWSMRFVEVEKRIDSPYWERESETERRKVVLPPRVIQQAFNRLDALAAELGILLDIQE